MILAATGQQLETLVEVCRDLRRGQRRHPSGGQFDSQRYTIQTAAQFDESLAAADEALERTERSNALWWTPEALRIKGETLLLCKGDTSAAEDHFCRSLDLARRQGALSWELRTATSLARLRRDTGRIRGARELLSSVYGRFTEGFGTADLRSAKALIEKLTV